MYVQLALNERRHEAAARLFAFADRTYDRLGYRGTLIDRFHSGIVAALTAASLERLLAGGAARRRGGGVR